MGGALWRDFASGRSSFRGHRGPLLSHQVLNTFLELLALGLGSGDYADSLEASCPPGKTPEHL